MTLTIDAKGYHYRQLNDIIRQKAEEGHRRILLKNVRGQRYIGAGLTYPELVLEVEGVTGEDLAFCLGGSTVILHNHGQNAIANTMDSGTVVVHGLGGDALAYGMRGGKLFVRDQVGYRVGIHMKEYEGSKPAVVVGATSGDFLGEYMAGGTLVVLNRHNAADSVAGQADGTLATGIHGGEIYIFNYEIPDYLPGIGVQIAAPSKTDLERIRPLIEEYCSHFSFDCAPLLERDVVKISAAGSRPFSRFYYPAYPVDTGLKPEQKELASPCEAACPVGIPTGRFLRHIGKGEYSEALSLIDDYTPFRYSNCGFICPHLCMTACSRGKVDFPVRTRELAHFFRNDQLTEVQKKYKERIAVIGAGPSGLTSAYFLARQGYAVDVFEGDNHPGGKMYQVISRKRLPLDDLQQDLQRIAALGVTINTNYKVDQELFPEIVEKYDHVIVAIGAHHPVIPPVKGKEFIRGGLELLKAFNRGEKPPLSSQAVLIGGGDAAIDGIEALTELGVDPEKITVIDIQTPSANLAERRKWAEAGVNFRYPLFLQEASAAGITAADAAGRPVFIPGDPFAFINEAPTLGFLPDCVKKDLNNRGFHLSAAEAGETSHPKISVTGDASGLGLVAHSIGKGRECAQRVHAVLRGERYSKEAKEAINPRDLPSLSYEKPACAGDISINEEPSRCLHCGVCILCDDCVEACPRQARLRDGAEFLINLSLCGGCGSCAAACKGAVIRMVPR